MELVNLDDVVCINLKGRSVQLTIRRKSHGKLLPSQTST